VEIPVTNLEPCGDESTLKYLEPLLFPDEDMDEGQFFDDVLSAVQRWFACSGWPNSVNLVTIPESFRRYVHADAIYIVYVLSFALSVK